MFIASRHRLRGDVDPHPLFSHAKPFVSIALAAAMVVTLNHANAQARLSGNPAPVDSASLQATSASLPQLVPQAVAQPTQQAASTSAHASKTTTTAATQATGHPSTTSVWEVRLSDLRLDRALQRWAQEAGYSLRWDADRYLVIGANARYTGSLEDAVEAVLATPGIRGSAYPLEACVYGNQPPLIRITRLGDQTDECL